MIWIAKAGAASCLALGLIGCSSPENKYYSLSAIEPPQHVVVKAAATMRTVAVDEISVPAYLDRPQIVVRQDGNRADIREFDRWVEPLDSMIRRTLSADLAARLGRAVVLDKPDKESYLLSVSIDDFGAEADHVYLRCQWTVKSEQEPGQKTPAHFFSQDYSIGKTGMSESVAAMSRLLGSLSEDIVQSYNWR